MAIDFSGILNLVPSGEVATGVSYIDFSIAIGIVIASFLLSYLFVFILRKVEHIAKKGSTLDYRILVAVQKPVRIIFLAVGVFIAINFIEPGLAIGGVSINTIFTVTLILTAAYTIARVAQSALKWYSEEAEPIRGIRIDKVVAPLMIRITKGTIFLLAFLVVLDTLGVEITSLIAGLGIAGLAVALALQDTLTNVFSGLYIGVERPVKKGDYVELQGTDLKGFVEDVGWRSTKIRQLQNNLIIVPNATLARSILINYNDPAPDMAVIIPVSVAYGSDLEKVEKVTVDVGKKIMRTVQGGMKDFEPFIRYNKFDNSGINFSVILRAQTFVDQYLITHEFMKALHKRYKEEGIEIPFPQTDVHFKTPLTLKDTRKSSE